MALDLPAHLFTKLLVYLSFSFCILTANGYPEPYAFDVPHSIVDVPNKQWVCVADRENGRVTCFDYNGKLVKEIHPTEMSKRVFAVTYSQENGKRTLMTLENVDYISEFRPQPLDLLLLVPGTGLFLEEPGDLKKKSIIVLLFSSRTS